MLDVRLTPDLDQTRVIARLVGERREMMAEWFMGYGASRDEVSRFYADVVVPYYDEAESGEEPVPTGGFLVPVAIVRGLMGFMIDHRDEFLAHCQVLMGVREDDLRPVDELMDAWSL